MAKKQLTRNYIMTYISDLYKDTYGIRPRGYNFTEFTLTELNQFWQDLIDQLERNNKEERAQHSDGCYKATILNFERKTSTLQATK